MNVSFSTPIGTPTRTVELTYMKPRRATGPPESDVHEINSWAADIKKTERGWCFTVKSHQPVTVPHRGGKTLEAALALAGDLRFVSTRSPMAK